MIVKNVCSRRVRARTQIPCHHKRCIEHWLCKDVHSAKWVCLWSMNHSALLQFNPNINSMLHTWQWSLCLIRGFTSYPLDAMCKNVKLILPLFFIKTPVRFYKITGRCPWLHLHEFRFLTNPMGIVEVFWIKYNRVNLHAKFQPRRFNSIGVNE